MKSAHTFSNSMRVFVMIKFIIKIEYLLVIVSLLSFLMFYGHIYSNNNLAYYKKITDIGFYGDDFESIRKKLPTKGVVGFMSNNSDPHFMRSKWFLAQYAFAPLVIDYSNKHDYMLVDADNIKTIQSVAAELGYKSITPINSQLYLLSIK